LCFLSPKLEFLLVRGVVGNDGCEFPTADGLWLDGAATTA